MKFRILLLCAIFAYALGQDTTTTAAPQTTVATQPSTAATQPSTAATQPSTAATQPSTAATQPSTAATQPSTDAPPPTTAAPPPTTAAPPPPTTVAPTPVPKAADVGTWSIGPDKEYCVLFHAGIQFGVVYLNKDGVWLNATINVPDNATVSPYYNCSAEGQVQNFELTWLSDNFKNYTMGIQFAPVPDSKGYSLNAIVLSFDYGSSEFIYPNDSYTGRNTTQNSNVSLSEYGLQSLQDSYMCMVDVYVGLTEHETHVDTVRFTDLKFLAYGKQGATDDFGYSTECDADFTNSDIVPIAVGCALAALVVIVLIAYLIGRKRSRQKGYQSV